MTFKRLFFALLTGTLLALGATATRPAPAHCAFCFTGQCTSGMVCGAGCMCLKQGGEIMGRCYSRSVVDTSALPADWVVLK